MKRVPISLPRRFSEIFSFLFLMFLFIDISAQNFPAGFSRVTLTNDLNTPTVMGFAPDGRIFVGQQGGDVRIIKNGVLLPTPFCHVDVHFSGERGLGGLVLDPDFASNGYVYLYYNLPDGSRNRISRFTANGDVAVPNSKVDILNLDPLSSSTIHNGGAMRFGNDGKLYVAVGENAFGPHAENLDTYHGKLLRLNKDGSPAAGNPYSNGSIQRRSIWASGFRNPFTMDIDRVSGKIFVNDVGGDWEEINDVTNPGGNYGWPALSGPSTNPAYTNPRYHYLRIPHEGNEDQGCAITGGTFFTPASTNYPSTYRGKYFFIDWCSKWINYIDPNTGIKTNFATENDHSVLNINVGPDGNIYFLTRTGQLYKIIYNNNNAPGISSHPANVTVSAGQPASFAVSATGAAPLTYQWQKNGVNIAGANAATYTISITTSADAGQYRAIVSNSFGSATSNAGSLTVTSFNANPTGTINTPANGSLYRGGDIINFSGSATDPEDGTLPASAFEWWVDFHHNTHHHPGPAITDGVRSGSFQIPTQGEPEATVWYRLYLRVTDSKGLQNTKYVDINPVKSTITLATQPAGLQVTMDGNVRVAPYATEGVVAVERTIGVVSPQVLNGKTYEFVQWTHGGTISQTISTPATSTTYSAVFKEVTGNTQSPYNGVAHAIPGKIQAEHYDLGGQNVAYFDVNGGNTGGAFRTDDVDIEATQDIDGGFNVGWVSAGEWLEYTVNVTETGSYTVRSRVATEIAGKSFRIEMDGATVATFQVPNTGGWQTWQTVTVTNVALTKGQKVMRIAMDGGDFNLNHLVFETNTVTAQTPYGGTPAVIPGTIQVENFDEGGQGIAFNDLTGANEGGAFRNTGVDIENCSDVNTGFNIGWVQTGEWLEYTVNVTESATYSLNARVATINAGRSFHVEADGATIATFQVPNTGNWQVWQTVTVANISLTQGQKVLRIYMDSGDFNLNYISFEKTAVRNSRTPYGGTARTIPGTIEAEHYDEGGQGIAFNDLTIANEGGAFRNQAVDLEACSDITGGFNVGWVQAGEWVEYTVNVAATRTYNITVRVASPNSGRSFNIEMNGRNVATVNVPNTGGWQRWQAVTITGVALTQGAQVMRIVMNSGDFNINNITFSNSSISRTGFASNQAAFLAVYPNPASKEVTIGFESEAREEVEVTLVNLLGETLIKKQVGINEGWQDISLNITGAPKGSYVLRVQGGNTHRSKTLLID